MTQFTGTLNKLKSFEVLVNFDNAKDKETSNNSKL